MDKLNNNLEEKKNINVISKENKKIPFVSVFSDLKSENINKKNNEINNNNISEMNQKSNVMKENKKIPLFNNIKNNKNIDKENNDSNKAKLITEENYIKNFKASIYLKENKNSFFGYFTFYNLKISFSPHVDNIKKFQENCIYIPESYSFSFFQIDKIKYLEKSFQIYLKDKRIFLFEYDPIINLSNILKESYEAIKQNHYYQYAIYYKNNISKQNYKVNGWKLYDIETEFYRQNLDLKEYIISKGNINYSLCPTYPKLLVIPSSFKEEYLTEVCKGREKQRFPVLTYYFNQEKTSLWRSSGSTYNFNSSYKEIDYINYITKNQKKIIIYEISSKSKKTNYENISFYDNCKIMKSDFDNIIEIRKAYKLYKLGKDEKKWLKQISLLIQYSKIISDLLYKGKQILIHCNEGYDYTSILSSIVQIILEPYYRTLRGFAVLIEKEWISFGFPFSLRNSFKNDNTKKKESSPIFILFLFIVYQFIFQFPNLFEFNEEFLLFLTEEIYTNKFGTFLFDSEKSLEEKKGKEITVSIWSEIFENKYNYYNSNYIELNDKLNPRFEIDYIDKWTNYLNFHKKIGECSFKDKTVYRYDSLLEAKKKEGNALEEIYKIIKENKIEDLLSDNSKIFLSKYE